MEMSILGDGESSQGKIFYCDGFPLPFKKVFINKTPLLTCPCFLTKMHFTLRLSEKLFLGRISSPSGQDRPPDQSGHLGDYQCLTGQRSVSMLSRPGKGSVEYDW